MNPQSDLPHPRLITMIVAAVLSAVIGIGLLSAVAGLFLRDGTPYEQALIAQRACADYAYVSEREACAKAFRGDSHLSSIASGEARSADPCARVEFGETAGSP